MKRVILITSTYNGEKYLPALLDSIASQTYSKIELFVRDDGSTDSTVSILRNYQNNFPQGKRLILVNDTTNDWKNRGAHQSYNFLIRSLERADYYMFCDQDDVWCPDKVSRAVAHMNKYPAHLPILYTHNYYVCDNELHVEHMLHGRQSISPEEMPSINLAQVIMTGTWAGVGMAQAFNHTLKEFAFHTGNFRRSIAIDCWISWVVAGMNGALIYDKKPLAYYRRHPGTFSCGDAGGLLRYRDWLRHMQRHCDNIVYGLLDYRRLYGKEVSKDRADFLTLFTSRRRLQKCLYPHRLRERLPDEIAFRLLILAGKI